MRDLHIHTNFSDGEYSPEVIIEMLREKNIYEFAICDHETLKGVCRALDYVKKYPDMIMHTGVEIGAIIPEMGQEVHLLVRDFNIEAYPMNSLVDEIQKSSALDIFRMRDFVAEKFGHYTSDKIINEILSFGTKIGKAHLYSDLIKHKKIDIKEYYAVMRTFKKNEKRFDASTVIEIGHKSGGTVCLAHPVEIEETYGVDCYQTICLLKNKGLDGLETKHSKHSQKFIEKCENYAKNLGLFATEGSDYHGPHVKPGVELGVCCLRTGAEKNFHDLF